VQQKVRELARRRKVVELQVAELQSTLEAEAAELEALITQRDERERTRDADRVDMARVRRSKQ